MEMVLYKLCLCLVQVTKHLHIYLFHQTHQDTLILNGSKIRKVEHGIRLKCIMEDTNQTDQPVPKEQGLEV